MPNNVILPFTLNVEMKTYQNKAFPLGAVKPNIEDYNVWLCNKLINCVWLKKEELDSIGKDLWDSKGGLTTHQSINMLSKSLAYRGIDIVDFNRNMLSEGNYITGFYNEFFIPQKQAYKKTDFFHDYIIFGYDDSKKTFHSAAYLKDTEYMCFDIPYENYYESIINVPSCVCEINYYKFKTSYKAKFDKSLIMKQIKKYYQHCEHKITGSHNVFGIDAWIKLAQHISDNYDNIDIRYVRIFMEHHYVMLNRIITFQNIYEKDCTQLIKDYQNICKQTEIIYFLSIKYRITKKNEILTKILEYIALIVCNERVIMERFFDLLATI